MEAPADAGEGEPALGVGGDGLRPGAEPAGGGGQTDPPRGIMGLSKRPPSGRGRLAVDHVELDLDPGGRLTVDVDQPAADDLLGLEVDLGRGLLGVGVELHAAEGRAGPGGAGQGVDGEEPGRRGADRLDAEAAVAIGRALAEHDVRRSLHVGIRPCTRPDVPTMSTGTPAAGRPSGPSTRPVTVIRARAPGRIRRAGEAPSGPRLVRRDRRAGPRRLRATWSRARRQRAGQVAGAGGEGGDDNRDGQGQKL